MTAEQAWDEITTVGRLHRKPSKQGLTWACVECAGGGECRCRFVDRSHTWRHFHNDQLVEARVAGWDVPPRLIPALARLLRFGGIK
jgi:hypothetical protein